MKQDKNTLYNWFTRGLKPAASQFADWFDSYWHKDENIPMDKVDGLIEALNRTVVKSYVDNSLSHEKANREEADAELQKNIAKEAAARARAEATKADLANGKAPAAPLPGYPDDVLKYADAASFPSVGEQGKLYAAADTNKTYRWSGSLYAEMRQGVLQVNADWDSAEGLSQILNKPTLAPVATSNNYNDLDNKPDLEDSGWISVPVENEAVVSAAAFQCRKIGKAVYLRGLITLKNDTPAEGAVAALPVGYRPPEALSFEPRGISIAPSGEVEIATPKEKETGESEVSLAGLSFLID